MQSRGHFGAQICYFFYGIALAVVEDESAISFSDVEANVGSHGVMRREEGYRNDNTDVTDAVRSFDNLSRQRHNKRPPSHSIHSHALEPADEEPVLGLSMPISELEASEPWTQTFLDSEGRVIGGELHTAHLSDGSVLTQLEDGETPGAAAAATTAAGTTAAATTAAGTTAAGTTAAAGGTTAAAGATTAAAAAGTTGAPAVGAAAGGTTTEAPGNSTNETNGTTEQITAKGAATSILLGAGITVVFLAGVYCVLQLGRKGTTGDSGNARGDAPRESSASRLAPRSYRQQRDRGTVNDVPAVSEGNGQSGADEPARPSTAASGYQSRRQQRSIASKEEEASF